MGCLQENKQKNEDPLNYLSERCLHPCVVMIIWQEKNKISWLLLQKSSLNYKRRLSGYRDVTSAANQPNVGFFPSCGFTGW